MKQIFNLIKNPVCFYLSITVLFFSTTVFSQSKSTKPDYKLVVAKNYVQSKNYYLLTLFSELPDVKKLINNDPVLVAIARNKVDSLNMALKTCQRDGLCFTSKLKFNDTEIKQVSNRLTELYRADNPLGNLVKQHLIPSGCYVLFHQLAPVDMLVKAWEQDAMGINFCIGVYAEGNKPNYPMIDSISFNTKDPRNNNVYLYNYVSLLYNTTSYIALQSKETNCFFTPSLTAALTFLELNEREQAADYEPMVAGENTAAFDKIKTINWKNFKYSVILIPGAGPEEPTVALSAESMLRCRLAAIQYKNGLAPFIVTSGGKVHPYKTKFCEAVEMKNFLVKKLGIPESAVIIDPHARHTTTNMRNTARIIYRYGMPFDKPGISCTTKGQSNMIESTLIARCIKELKVAPYKNGNRLSETEVEFYPLIEALQINPTEPIDPK